MRRVDDTYRLLYVNAKLGKSFLQLLQVDSG